MHQLESYALACGVKIDKPYMYEHYFPVPADGKYITLQQEAKFPSRQYQGWQQVIDLLHPTLERNSIKILQIGSDQDKPLKRVINLSGHTTLKQVNYIIKNSILHLGIDSFAVHMASAFDKKIVGLYSNMSPDNSGPYWSNSENCELITSPKGGNKPSYSFDENPKTINKIKPENVAFAVCNLLGLKFKKPYETLHIGERYHEEPFLVFCPRSVHFVEGNERPIEYRMDYHFDEENLEKQLRICKCGIVTDKAISLDMLKKYRPHVAHLIYKITKNDDPKFINKARRLGINIMLVSKLSDEEINEKKIDYYDIARINHVEQPDKDLISTIEKAENLFYKSNKVIMSQRQTFSSHPKYKKGLPTMGNFEPIEKTETFFDDLDHFHIVKMLD